MPTLANSEYQDDISHDTAISSGTTLLAKTKMIFRKKKIRFWDNYFL